MIIPQIRRIVLEARRPKEWRTASRLCKKIIPYCSLCKIKKTLEAHDIIPYRKAKKLYTTVGEWFCNMVTLCRSCHRKFAHCIDPRCYKYNEKIQVMVRAVRDFMESGCRT